MSRFQKATRKQSKLRLALVGPSGSGKTFSALSIAKHLGKRIAVIDSERGSARLYAGRAADFDVLELENYSPRDYYEAIREAEREGYDVIVVDSLTHAWSGKGGALEMVDNAARRSQSKNSYMAWRDVTPEHNALVDAMVGCKSHIVVTMRVKTEYVLEEDKNGKKTPRKVGLAPIQRDGLEYEFTVVGDLDLEHNLIVSKTRIEALDGAVIKFPGQQIAETILADLNDGEPRTEAPPAATRELAQKAVAVFPDATVVVTQSKVDEYGLTMPASPCPRVTKAGPNKGKLWSELPGPLVEKMYGEAGDRMNDEQREWCEYLMAKRQARKAQEAAIKAAQDTSSEGGGWIAGDEPAEGEAAQ